MKVRMLEHDPAEGPGEIAGWVEERGHRLQRFYLDRGGELPPVEEVDFLIVMGGPMNIYQYRDHPWLPTEKRFIGAIIEAGKPALGLCLGAQLFADVLGGKVMQNPVREIGWFPVKLLARPGPFAAFPEKLTALHWHGDTFTLPPKAQRIAESAACANQAFLFGDRVVGLQFHLEVGAPDLAWWWKQMEADLEPGPFIQNREQMLDLPNGIPESRTALFGLLDALAAKAG